tara:strand:- start:246 stop:1151 length:906 start_codon:yes stop_codon:yes gene_type:complete
MKNQILNRKIVVGTAQFGDKYGITNTKGSPNFNEISKILNVSKNENIRFIDTAANYKKVEKKLGRYDVKSFEIITKIPKILPCKGSIKQKILKIVSTSVRDLRKKSLYAILLHDSSDLKGRGKKEVYETLLFLKKRKLVKKIGVSIYNVDEIMNLINNFKIDIIQVPLNLIDRRILDKKLLDFLKKKDIEIHVRSIFLQGLLLSKKIQNNQFKKYSKIWKNLDLNCKKNKIDILTLALNFVFSQKDIKKIIIGFDNSIQLSKILKCIKKFRYLKEIDFFENLISKDKKLINPNYWNDKKII